MMPNRTLAPDIKDAVEFDVQLKPYHSYTLDNGTTVYSIDAGAEEVVMVELVFHHQFQELQLIMAAEEEEVLGEQVTED